MTTAYPREVSDLFDVLSNDLSWLNIRWTTYRMLYGKTPERIQLLNEAAAGFFFVVQESLYDDVVLNICRLSDPPTSGRNGAQMNLTLRRLADVIGALGHHDLHDELLRLLEELRGVAASMVSYRNKRLAHIDLNVATQQAVLDGPSRQDVDAALRIIAAFLNKIAKEYRDTTVLYDLTVGPHGDQDQLVNLLKAGFRYQALVDEEVILCTDDHRGTWGDT